MKNLKLNLKTFIALLVPLTVGFSTAHAETGRYRLMFNDDPSSIITLGWEQMSGDNPEVLFGKEDYGQNWEMYPQSVVPHRSTFYMGMDNQFAKLDKLEPNTNYYFLIKDSEGTSERYWFKTCPDINTQQLSFISGGDSRSGQTQRINANKMVAKLRPHAVLFGGDLVNTPSDASFQTWMDDWQFTITSDNQMIPVVHSFGNHESYGTGGRYVLRDLFDLVDDSYFRVVFGGDLFSVYTLNGELMPTNTIPDDAIRVAQRKWLESTLPTDSSIWKSAQYHRPMVPHHSSKVDGLNEYNDWANLFYNYGVRLVMESDAHVVKITNEVRPSVTAIPAYSDSWFATDNIGKDKGITFIGEGSWGTIRTADETHNLTAATGSFYEFNWIWVNKCKIIIRTIDTQNPESIEEHVDGDQFSISGALEALVWKPVALPTGVVEIIKCKTPISAFETSQNSICENNEIEFKDKSSNNPETWSWDFGDGKSASEPNPKHTYQSAGKYTVTLTTTNSEGSNVLSMENRIEVSQIPELSFSGKLEICEGETTLITANGADSYVWKNGLGISAQVYITPLETSTYYLTGKKTSCETLDSVTVVVIKVPDVQLATFPKDTVSINSGLISLPLGTPTGGTYSGNGVSGSNFDPILAGSGSHEVSYSVHNNKCFNSSSQQIFVVGELGMDNQPKLLFTISPNPAREFIIITKEVAIGYDDMVIYDMTGSVMHKSSNNSYPLKLDVSNWSKGKYIVKFSDENQGSLESIIVIQ
jgi:PKD repeat protein